MCSHRRGANLDSRLEIAAGRLHGDLELVGELGTGIEQMLAIVNPDDDLLVAKTAGDRPACSTGRVDERPSRRGGNLGDTCRIGDRSEVDSQGAP